MYCPSCGTPNADNSRFCMSCGAALQTTVPPRTPKPSTPITSGASTAVSGAAGSVGQLIAAVGLVKLIVIIVAIVLGGVVIVSLLTPKNPAEKAVEDMYNALAKGDMNAYMDTILPTNRSMPNPLGVLGAMSISAGPVGFDVGKLTAMSFRDLRTHVVRATNDYALVQAEGYLRMQALGMEVHFCDQHDVRQQGGKWYVDVFAQERRNRMLQYQQRLLSEIQNSPGSSSGDPLAAALSGLNSQQLERYSNFCVANP